MGKHRRPARRIPWRRLRAAYADLARRYEELEADHCLLVGDLEVIRARSGTNWGRRNEDLIRTQPVPVLLTRKDPWPGLDPRQASDLTHRAGLLNDPGGAWPEGDGGTTG